MGSQTQNAYEMMYAGAAAPQYGLPGATYLPQVPGAPFVPYVYAPTPGMTYGPPTYFQPAAGQPGFYAPATPVQYAGAEDGGAQQASGGPEPSAGAHMTTETSTTASGQVSVPSVLCNVSFGDFPQFPVDPLAVDGSVYYPQNYVHNYQSNVRVNVEQGPGQDGQQYYYPVYGQGQNQGQAINPGPGAQD
jgi:hypothetical protein